MPFEKIPASSVPAHVPDPAVPMIVLPSEFRTRRSNTAHAIKAGGSVDLFAAKGPGCVRHIWFHFEEYEKYKGAEIEICVDDETEPQVRVPVRAFFGLMHDFEAYHVASAGITLFPQFTILNDPRIPQKASPGANCYLPIPFTTSCRISLHSPKEQRATSMVDWHQYPKRVDLTPYRFHAQHHAERPPTDGGVFPILREVGRGFVAGYVMGWKQQEHSDMVFHTGGTRVLIDGQTDPHAISGHNVEDDFGFSWGFNQYQCQWSGCPLNQNRGRNDQDGVFYRFFGPDPIAFHSSISFTSNARADDTESTVYYYKIPGTKAPAVNTPETWQVVGPFSGGNQRDLFQREEFVERLPPGPWSKSLKSGEASYDVHDLSSEYGWLRLENTFFNTMIDHSAYARTTLTSDNEREATLRITFDNWAIVWLNGEKIAALDREEELDTVRLPINLKAGENELLIKNNNRTNHSKELWVLNCAIE